MDTERARALLEAERAEVRGLLADEEQDGQEDRETEDEPGDYADAAQPLTQEGMDDAIAESLRDRLAAIERALTRIDKGTYGTSVRSGQPIPDERLEADPAAELTVEEAADSRPLPGTSYQVRGAWSRRGSTCRANRSASAACG
jgi:DnaK suppressor protein